LTEVKSGRFRPEKGRPSVAETSPRKAEVIRERCPQPRHRPAAIVDNFFEEVLGGIFGRFFGTHRPWR